jgi:hypothetical protein
MQEIICSKCSSWVDCGIKYGERYGFCLLQDLFTYTARTDCVDFTEGKPLTEKEYDEFNYSEIGEDNA